MATKEAPRTPAESGSPLFPGTDIRRSRPYLLSRTPLRSLLFRAASLCCLVALDLLAVGLGLYGGLVLREVYYGHDPIFWGILWRDAEADYFPFVALVTVLVFWQAGLYAQREQRTGFGRIVSSLVVVALLRRVNLRVFEQRRQIELDEALRNRRLVAALSQPFHAREPHRST